MILGEVIGNVWATRKVEKLNGLKFLIVQQVDLEYKAKNNYVIAADTIGAGEGEYVLVVQGSSARQTPETEKKPIDAVVIAIIDKINYNKEFLYKNKE